MLELDSYILNFNYPSDTSSIIIIVNPRIRPILAKSVFPPPWLSGITSSTTIKIIAPAAKARAYGSIG